MTPKRGTHFDDVLSRRVWTLIDLQDIQGNVSPLMYLACLFFLSRHAECRAYVVEPGVFDAPRKKAR